MQQKEARINRNIMEFKDFSLFRYLESEARINRNIMEFKVT